MNNLAMTCMREGKNNDAKSLMEEQLAALKQLYGEDSALYQACLHRYGRMMDGMLGKSQQ